MAYVPSGLPVPAPLPAAIRFEGVAKVYPARKGVEAVTALDGIDLAVPEGSPSKSGKTHGTYFPLRGGSPQ